MTEARSTPTQFTRRRLLEIGGLGAAGLTLPELLVGQVVGAENSGILGFGRAKRALLMFMWGGPSHLDTWDLKPDSPAEVRGPYQPISTSVPGLQFSELLPRLAVHADKLALVRSVSHTDPAHLSSVHHLTTGQLAPRVNSDADPPSRKDSPHVGSLISKLRPTGNELPSSVIMPWHVNHPSAPGGTAPGQHGGWLGSAFDPFLVGTDARGKSLQVSGLGLEGDVTAERFSQRRQLLEQLTLQRSAADAARTMKAYDGLQQQACELLTSERVKSAFDLRREPDDVRDQYGRHIHGQCVLMARRLLEAGVPLVSINWHNDCQNFWDTHGDNFNALKNRLCPPADRAFAALLQDLSQRGMLDDTLILWVGEFGRRPQITTANAGREHWPWCYTAVFAGGGIRGGQVYGRSDKIGAYPVENPVTPADLTATMLHALGISCETLIQDSEQRPHRIVGGDPILPLFA